MHMNDHVGNLTLHDAVLQRPLVKEAGGELSEQRMHAVLHVETKGLDTRDHEPLKEGLREASLSSLLTHHNRPQLAVVTHQDQLLRS